jgi:hypothetical protein
LSPVRLILLPPSSILVGAVRALEVGRLFGERPARVVHCSGCQVRKAAWLRVRISFAPYSKKGVDWKQVPHPDDPN